MGYAEKEPQPGLVQTAFLRDPRTTRRLNQAERRAEL
jgi:hypothetical protein